MATPTFLTLPSEVRRRIYDFVDLVRICPVDLSYSFENSRAKHRKVCTEQYTNFSWGLRSRSDMNIARNFYCRYRRKRFKMYQIDEWLDHTTRHDCMCPHLAVQMLTVCRVVYEEVFDIIYSRNMFRMTVDGPTLKTVQPRLLARMTSLCLRLNFCSCITGHYCKNPYATIPDQRCHRCHVMCRRGHDGPLKIEKDMSVGPRSRDLLNSWMQLCTILTTSIRPQMRLTVICDCEDEWTAAFICQSIQTFPRIAACALRLGQSPNSRLKSLAKNVVTKLTSASHPQPTESQHFPFTKLPEELQRHILSYTDLVAPAVLQWNPKPARESKDRLKLYLIGDSRCCHNCTDAIEVCCCCLNHAAYTSSRCTCWQYPASLFLVNKTFYEYALELFFSSNRFVICEDTWSTTPEVLHVRTRTFLRQLPRRARDYLTWIRINFWVFDGGIFHMFEHWDALAKELSQCPPHKLTIDLDLEENQVDRVYNRPTEQEELGMWNIYLMFTRRLSPLRLKDFFVRLAWPPDPEKVAEREDCERRLEKLVMGEDYDAEARGKYTNRGLSAYDLFLAQKPVFAVDGTQVFPW